MKLMLGDWVEAVFKLVMIYRISKYLEQMTKKDCGCTKRKHQLNRFGEWAWSKCIIMLTSTRFS